MLFLLTLLQFYKYNEHFPLELLGNSELGCMSKSFDDLINDGMTSQEILKCFSRNSSFIRTYEKYLDKASDKDFALDEPFFENISNYFDLQNSLAMYIPQLTNFIETNREMFSKLRPIVTDLGPDICNVISLDYTTIINLYDYVLIDKNNDGVQFGKLLDVLGLSNEWIPQVAKIISFFDMNEPIHVLMDGLNAKTEYEEFLRNLNSLKFPANNQQKFFSFVKIINIFSNAIDVFYGFYNNFYTKYMNEFIKPMFKTYVINPVNIFDKSIYERATSLVKALVKVQNYALSCDKNEDEMTENDFLKCQAFEIIINMIAKAVPATLLEEEENYTQIDLEMLKEKASIFTNQEINLTSILIDNFTISENYVKFFFGSVANLTDTSKNYVNLLEGSELIFNETESEEEQEGDETRRRNRSEYEDDDDDDSFDISSIPYQKYIKNLTNIIKFIDNLDDTSNFKQLFEYLGISEYWETFNLIMEQVDRDNTICDNLIIDMMKIDQESCENLVKGVKQIGTILTTTKKLLSLANEPTKIILDCLIPLFQKLDLRISLLFNLLHKVVLAPLLNNIDDINLPKSADYTNIIKSSGNLLTKTFTLLDDFTPTLLKKIPFLGDLLTKVSSKIIGFLDLLAQNVDLPTFFEFFMGGSSVLTKMIMSGANAIAKNGDITGQDFAKAIQPTTFLNVFETANKVNKIEDMRFKNLADSIIFDGSSKLSSRSAKLLEGSTFTFNDFIPFKSLVENSNELSSGLNHSDLKLNVVAKSLGTEKDDVKQSLSSVIKTALSPPADAILETSVSSGYDRDFVKAYLDGIGLFSQQVNSGEMVKTKTNEYIKIKKSKGIPLGAIIGIVVAAVVVVGLAVFLGVYFGVIRKRGQDDDKKEDTSGAGEKQNETKDNENI